MVARLALVGVVLRTLPLEDRAERAELDPMVVTAA
jgi:hypothetical protein